MKKTLIAIACLVTLSACGVNADDGRSALEAQGITNVVIGGHAFFGCGEKDSFRSKFTGTGVNGKPVSGVLCGGFLKGITVRYN